MSSIAAQKLVRMKQPVPLQTDEFVPWSNGRGNDVWRMFCAAITGDIETIKTLVADEPQLVGCTYEYITPLRFAVRENHIPVVEFLLEKGANPVHEFGDSLLTVARERGYKDLEALLVHHLEQRYHIAPEGDALPVHIRAFDKQKVKDLVKENRSLLQKADGRGNLPIHWAVLTRQLDLVEHFLELGADINAMRPDGARPLDLTNGDYHYRSTYRDLPSTGLQKHQLLAGYLIAKGAVYDISVAAQMGHYDRVKELLDKDPSLANRLPSYYGYYSGVPLRCAAFGGFIEIAQLLLDYGADPNKREPNQAPHGSSLHAAISKNHLSIVRILLEHGADPNGSVESSGSCLWMAYHMGVSQEMIDLIISYGGRLTIEMIAYDGNVELLSRMLEADHNLPFNEDEHRVILEHKPLVELILKYQPDFLKVFSLRGLDDPELAKWLIANGLDPNTPDWLGITPLHRAAEDGKINMASAYLEAGASTNAIDTELSSTPLGRAAKRGQKEMVAWLLQHGADASLPLDEPWARPVEWARRGGYDEIVELLK